jgi:DNA-binding NtrC family response regulator
MPKKPSLLIVDDEANVTRTLQMIFEREGYDVVPAFSCAEALNILNANGNFDAVITDLNMERPDIGLQVARHAKSMRSQPAVVICTGFANISNSREALAMHVDYLAHKPVDIDELRLAVSNLISRRRNGRKRRP